MIFVFVMHMYKIQGYSKSMKNRNPCFSSPGVRCCCPPQYTIAPWCQRVQVAGVVSKNKNPSCVLIFFLSENFFDRLKL